MATEEIDTIRTWGFIGLGNMGGPMVLNLRQNIPDIAELIVYDTNICVVKKVAADATGEIIIAPNLSLISNKADIIITCLPSPAIAEQVFAALLSRSNEEPRSNRLIIDCSTIDPVTSQRIYRTLHQAEFGIYVDAPMSGGVIGARVGSLSFMVGGTEDVFTRVQPILEKMGKIITHCGKQGTGLSAKLANNYLLAINNLATAEAMNFGIKAGLDPSTLARIINSATGRNWASEVNNPVPGVVETAPASRQFQGGFATRLMNKDLKLAIMAAQQVQAPLPLSGAAFDVYSKLTKNKRYSGLDFSVVYNYLRGSVKPKL
ncbi:hypothetical protein N7467_001886 [Penicillium canescens]|nr:hypothetical protein N7467_001886 [Penicillium canescens]